MKRLPAFALLAAAPFALAACATVPGGPQVEGNPVAEGSAVPIDQPVYVGDLVVTPKAVVEDSRCPMNARCVWAGRLVVKTRIDGAGWRETKDLTLGADYGTHGQVLALVSGIPEKRANQETPIRAYRFVYEKH